MVEKREPGRPGLRASPSSLEGLHPLARGLLALGEREGLAVLEREGGGKIYFYVAERTLLHATGLVPLAFLLGHLEARPPRDREAEVVRLAEILRARGWYEAFRLATLQVSLTLQAVPRLPGRKRLSFGLLEVPRVLKEIGGGVRLTRAAMELFFPDEEGEEWEDWE